MREEERRRTEAAHLLGIRSDVPAVRVNMALREAVRKTPEREQELRAAADILLSEPPTFQPVRSAPTIEAIPGGQRRKLRAGQPGHEPDPMQLTPAMTWLGIILACIMVVLIIGRLIVVLTRSF